MLTILSVDLEGDIDTGGGELRRRAGQRAHAEAKRLRRKFVRENWRIFAGATASYGAVGIALIAIEEIVVGRAAAAFAAGVAVVGYAFFIWMILEEDGTRRLRNGAFAERETSAALRTMEKQGWHVIDRVEFRHFDVDHVAVGPGGVLAVESKYTAVPWKLTSSGLEGPYRDPVRQARSGARAIRLLLKSEGVEIPVVPTVVIWGRGRPAIPNGGKVVDAVAILSGPHSNEWRQDLPGAHLDQCTVEAVREILQGYVDRHEAWRTRQEATRPTG